MDDPIIVFPPPAILAMVILELLLQAAR